MKVFQLSLLVVALASASQASAANGLPSQATLEAMGLSGLNVMTDSEGLAIRGLGYTGASAYGKSWANVSTHYASAGSVNGYNVKGKHLAGGRNESEAEVEIEFKKGHGGGYGDKKSKGGQDGGYGSKPKSIEISVFAGGSSIGFTKK